MQHEIDWDVVSIEVDEEKCGTGKIALIEGAIQVLSPGKRDRRDRGRSHHAIGMRLASQLFEPAAYELCSDGAEIARVGGTANSLAMKLGAYLDLASGRVDRTTAARRATTHDVVGDRTAEESSSASRNLYAAEQLIAAGRFDDAKPILGRMLAQRYDPARAHYLMGRVLEHEQTGGAQPANIVQCATRGVDDVQNQQAGVLWQTPPTNAGGQGRKRWSTSFLQSTRHRTRARGGRRNSTPPCERFRGCWKTKIA